MNRTDAESVAAWEYKHIYYNDDKASMKRKGRLFTILYNSYLPYVNTAYNRLASLGVAIREGEFRSMYSELILYAVKMWSGSCKFTNYLHTNLLGLSRMARKYVSVVGSDKACYNAPIDDIIAAYA